MSGPDEWARGAGDSRWPSFEPNRHLEGVHAGRAGRAAQADAVCDGAARLLLVRVGLARTARLAHSVPRRRAPLDLELAVRAARAAVLRVAGVQGRGGALLPRLLLAVHEPRELVRLLRARRQALRVACWTPATHMLWCGAVVKCGGQGAMGNVLRAHQRMESNNPCRPTSCEAYGAQPICGWHTQQPWLNRGAPVTHP